MGKPTATVASAAAAVALLLAFLAPPAMAASFTCSGKPQASCTSLLGFPVVNASTTNYTTIAALFGIPVSDLLAANNRTAADAPRPVSKPTVSVPIPCTCSGGTGTSGNTTHYTVKKDDGLDYISRVIFGGLVVYQEVAKANGIPNPDKIDIGQLLTIPLPCSCDQVVPGEVVIHYAYKVAEGDDFEGIAAQTGATVATIQTVNKIPNPKDLKSEQILDVPLRACGRSPSLLLAGTNLAKPGPCPARSAARGPLAPGAAPGPSSPGSTPPPPRSAAIRALPDFAWTPLLVLFHTLLVALSFPRLG